MKKAYFLVAAAAAPIVAGAVFLFRPLDPGPEAPVERRSVEATSQTPDDVFEAASSDPQAKLVARGDVNRDGVEDAIVQEIFCGGSCSVNLALVLGMPDGGVRAFEPRVGDNFAPAYIASSAIKSELSSIDIDGAGTVTLAGRGLSCGNLAPEEPCSEELWRQERAVRYRFDGTKFIEL